MASQAPLTLRVFVSSPGDVVDERRLAREVMQDLEAGHLLRDKVRFDIVAWDDTHASTPIDGRETPQASVNRYTGRPAECDLTLVILWSRIGTVLPPDLTRADGTRYESGTVWEYEDARDANRAVFVYRRTATPQIDLDDPELERKRAQYNAVKTFFGKFTNSDGSLQSGCNTYADPTGFAQLLRQHLEAFVNQHLSQDTARVVASNDPNVTRILTLVDELEHKTRQLGEKDAEIARLSRENEELRRAAIARTLTAAAQPDASDLAIAAADALEAGDTRPAEDLLRGQEREQAAQIGTSGHDDLQQRREAAELAREQGALAMGQDVRAALEAYQRAAQYEPDDTWTHFFIGDLQKRLGDLGAAMESYRKAAATIEVRVQAGDLDIAAQRDVSVSCNRIGDVLRDQGDGQGALVAYRTGLTIAEALGAFDPANTEWQHDLSVSHDKIGNVLRAHGDHPSALAAHRKALAIREMLAARDPANTYWQRDLSVSHNKIGDVLQEHGDGPAAIAAYRKGLAIGESLAARDPDDTQWQRDLSVSHDRIGGALEAQGDSHGALDAYRRELAIAEALAACDPGNSQWQHDLSVGYNNIGDVLQTLGDLPSALAAYLKDLLIAEALSARDQANAQWQRDLSESHNDIGDVLQKQGDGPGALAAYRKALAIAEALAARDPSNAQWQCDLSDSCKRLGSLEEGHDSATRRHYLVRGRNILVKLKVSGRLSPSRDQIDWFEREIKQLSTGRTSGLKAMLARLIGWL